MVGHKEKITKYMFVFISLMGIGAWCLLFVGIIGALFLGGEEGSVRFTFNRFDELIIEFWLILITIILIIVFTIYLYLKDYKKGG